MKPCKRKQHFESSHSKLAGKQLTTGIYRLSDCSSKTKSRDRRAASKTLLC